MSSLSYRMTIGQVNIGLSWMEENQTATYFLRSRLFTYDIMKNVNFNISLWFFRSNVMSYTGKQLFYYNNDL